MRAELPPLLAKYFEAEYRDEVSDARWHSLAGYHAYVIANMDSFPDINADELTVILSCQCIFDMDQEQRVWAENSI